VNNFKRVGTNIDDHPRMRHPQATLMRDFTIEHDARHLLEISF
jgi:hypothetical protein